jgi:endothelin-converting enzyme/putative endopeptidase
MTAAENLSNACLTRRNLCASLLMLPLALATHRTFAATEIPTGSGWGVDLSSINPAMQPGDDFYEYVNKGWMDTAAKPVGYSQYGEMNAMFLRTEARIKTIIETAAGEPSESSKLADLYTSYADVAAIDQRGLQPIRADLDSILSITTHDQVAKRMAHPMSHTIAGSYVFLDAGDTRQSLLHIDQQVANGRVVGLPSANHYASGDEKYAKQRLAYQNYIAQTLGRAGVENGTTSATSILELESRLAAEMWSSEQLRDRKLNYHRMSVKELESYAPGFPWQSYLQATGYPPVETIVLNTDTAIRGGARIFAETPVDTWRAYLAFHWIHNHAHLLPTVFQDASFQFYGTELYGLKTRRSRADRGVQFVSQNLPELVGARYIGQFFKASDRDTIEAMAPFMKQAFRARIEQASWLDQATRATALAKLDKIGFEAGLSG